MAGRCSCNQACACCSQSSPSVNVGGVGIPGNCFVPDINYSEELGNRAQAGTDGGLYVGPGCLLDRTGAQIPPNGAGCVQIPPPTILNYSGVPIPPDTLGRIPLPTGGPPPSFGAGLTTATDGTLIAAVSGTFPTANAFGTPLSGADTDGAIVYVDSTGELRAPAEHTSLAVAAAADIQPIGLVPVSSTAVTAAQAPLVIVNPSPSRQMTVERVLSCIVDLVIPASSQPSLDLEVDTGGGFATARNYSWPEPSAAGTTIRFRGEVNHNLSIVLAPGDSYSVSQRIRLSKGGGGGDPVIIYVRAIAHMYGTTR